MKNPLPIPVGIGILVAGWSLAFWINALWQGNPYLVYPVSRLRYVFLPAIVFVIAGYLIVHRSLSRLLTTIDRTLFIRVSIAIVLTAGFASWMWPAPLPVIQGTHELVIRSTQEKNDASGGAILEIRAVHGLDGAEIPLNRFELSGDWQIQNGHLVSEGKLPQSVARYEGPLAGGVVLLVRYNLDAGVLSYSLDGRTEKVDLYTDRGISYPIYLRASLWQGAAIPQKLFTGMAWCFQFLGLVSLGFLLWLLAMTYRRTSLLLVLVLIGLIFWNYLGVKRSYQEFNAGRAFRDTYSYVVTAEKPLLSGEFWFSQRTFPIPLLYKFLSLNTSNYTEPGHLKAVGDVQLWLSVACWTALALSLAAATRALWLKPLVFGLVLFFSLSLEISFWDSLLLSESLSFSFFALLLAGWIGFGLVLNRIKSGWWRWASLIGLLAITIWYSFTRDTNLYFVVIGAGLLLLAVWLHRLPGRTSTIIALVYVACVAGLFLFQNATLQIGDRWQIHLYDHLALRILPDPQARQYFAEAGLPINPDLMAITGMIGYEYHDYLDFDPKMAPVRAWIAAHGRTTFLKYLISHPDRTFVEPLRRVDSLINGSNLEYRYPNHPKEPIPAAIANISGRFYPHRAALLWWLGLIFAISLVAEWRQPGLHGGIWWVWAALAVSIYPLMVVIWNGNPLEIERHAAQIGIQLRLAGLVSVVLLLDRLAPGLTGHLPPEESGD